MIPLHAAPQDFDLLDRNPSLGVHRPTAAVRLVNQPLLQLAIGRVNVILVVIFSKAGLGGLTGVSGAITTGANVEDVPAIEVVPHLHMVINNFLE